MTLTVCTLTHMICARGHTHIDVQYTYDIRRTQYASQFVSMLVCTTILVTLRFLCLNVRKVSLVAICVVIQPCKGSAVKRRHLALTEMHRLYQSVTRGRIYRFFNGVVITKSSIATQCTWPTRSLHKIFSTAPQINWHSASLRTFQTKIQYQNASMPGLSAASLQSLCKTK